jgi:hypothetical protein
MRLPKFALFALAVAVLIPGLALAEDEPAPDHRSVEEIVKAVIAAQNPFAAAEQYKALFTAAGAKGLAALRSLPHDSIAIQAAWQEVNLTLPEKNLDDGNPVVFRPDRDKLNWFFGFLEGRGRILAPRWWADSLLDARANTRSNIYFPDGDSADQVTPFMAGVVTKSGKSILSYRNDAVALPAELRPKRTGSEEVYSALFTPKNVYVAKYDATRVVGVVACVNSADGRLIWKTQVWGSYWYQIGGGVGPPRVSIELQNDRVLVFGVSGLGLINVEAFRADNGKNIFRFSNTYCEHN